MPMRRDQPALPLRCPPYLLSSPELQRLQGVFRRALQVAFASSLFAGCASQHEDGSAPSQTGGQQSPAVAGMRSPPSAAGAKAAAGHAGTDMPASAGSGGATPIAADGGALDARVPDGSTGSVGPICDNSSWQMLAGLNPALPVDYVSLRTTYAARPTPFDERASQGTACASAPHPMTCQSALDATTQDLALTDNCGQVGPCRHWLVTTDGDDVTRYASRTELLAFLGPLDTEQEVLLLLDYDGYQIDCDATRVEKTANGYEATVLLMIDDCPVQNALLHLQVSTSGEVVELLRQNQPSTNVCIGRRPEGLSTSQPSAASSRLGAHFADMAHLEAASVTAFEVLAIELEHHGAPSELIDAARAAARDEIRHADYTRTMALRYGASVTEPRIAARPLRTLEALALDNAVEGCVRETFGAAIGGYQAAAANDASVATLMQALAEDETRHAALAFAIDAWVMPRLAQQARDAIDAARRDAVRQLAREISCEPALELQQQVGVPSAATALRLHDALSRELWTV